MERRDFLKVSLGAAALAAIGNSRAFGAEEQTTTAGGRVETLETPAGISPRRCELIDADWRFQMEPAEGSRLGDAVGIEQWIWTPGTPEQESKMVDPALDTSGGNWKQTRAGDSTLPEHSYGWFRATLPALKDDHRILRFGCVDDNGTIYLNGKKIFQHTGWTSSFDVPLDSAWRSDGPNVVVVLVENIGGAGGITKPVTLGTSPPASRFSDRDYDDSAWRKLDLPHDYVVEGDYSSKADRNEGYMPRAPAWYRRTLSIPASDQRKILWLYFEGVFRDASIFLNGRQIGFQDDGYDSFHIDITKDVKYGADNSLAVHVNPGDFEGWWYEGGGIYRHVWLNSADPVHVAPWGVYVISDVRDVLGNPSAKLSIQTKIMNKADADQTVELESKVLDPDGQLVGTATGSYVVPAGADFDAEQSVDLKSARLWSLEQRNLYRVISTISRKGTAIDAHEQKFGIRTIRFDADKGFFLNEKSVKLQGTCNHQDFVGVGVAIPDSLFYYRMQKLKDIGCNAIRCSHNPMTPAMYDACDVMGLLVMDETRHPVTAPVAKAEDGQPYKDTWHIESMILRDRNRPSIIMWSLSNEENNVQGDAFGAEMLAYLMKVVKKHDPTRPITTAVNMGAGPGWMIGYGKVEDLLGVNYNYGAYDWLHKRYPDKPIFGSETASDLGCRGIYSSDKAAAHQTSSFSPEGSWEPLGSREYVCGGFVWTGFDYRGEPTPYDWPEVNSNFGLLDMCGFPKDMGMYYKAWWMQAEPMVHIFPHWNWPGKDGQGMTVWCHSNCEEVELIVNGQSEGRRKVTRFRHVQWDNVKYQPGKVEAKGYIGANEAASKVIETTGAPAALQLSAFKTELVADGQDVSPITVSVVDEKGRVVPVANNMVRFSVNGVGVNAGVGNGDPSCHEPNQADSRSAFSGLCMVLARATRKPGVIRVEATADGLQSASIVLRSNAPHA